MSRIASAGQANFPADFQTETVQVEIGNGFRHLCQLTSKDKAHIFQEEDSGLLKSHRKPDFMTI
eukprot:1141854-Pelagomonas_calceolata.AAC.2